VERRATFQSPWPTERRGKKVETDSRIFHLRLFWHKQQDAEDRAKPKFWIPLQKDMRIVARGIPFLTVSLLIACSFISQALAQESSMKITMEPYQWTDEMKRQKITTPDRGLTLEISFSNLHEKCSVTLTSVVVVVQANYLQETYARFSKEWKVSSLMLVPKQVIKNYIAVELATYSNQETIGKWEVKATYKVERQEWRDEKGSQTSQGVVYMSNEGKIEPYPFEFRVLGQEQFSKELEQMKQRPFIEIVINNPTIQVVSFGSVTAVILALALKTRRKRR